MIIHMYFYNKIDIFPLVIYLHCSLEKLQINALKFNVLSYSPFVKNKKGTFKDPVKMK